MATGSETYQLFGVIDIRLFGEVGANEAVDVHENLSRGRLSSKWIWHSLSF
jgi:hypothetical protein